MKWWFCRDVKDCCAAKYFGFAWYLSFYFVCVFKENSKTLLVCFLSARLIHQKIINYLAVWQWPNGWTDEDATTWYWTIPRPTPHCVRRGPSCPSNWAEQPPPSFRPMSIVATVAHLLSSCTKLASYSAPVLKYNFGNFVGINPFILPWSAPAIEGVLHPLI